MSSAPNEGRNSPEPEKQPGKQGGQTADGKVGAGPDNGHAGKKSDEQKGNVLKSNPEGPMEKAAHEKVSKDGRGDGGETFERGTGDS